MRITIDLPDDFLTDSEKRKLERIFGTSDKKAFSHALKKVARCALTEYADMFLDRDPPSRASDMREHRLFILTKCYFEGRLPREDEVSAMFQLPPAQSKTLIRALIASFGFELEAEIQSTLEAALPGSRFRRTR